MSDNISEKETNKKNKNNKKKKPIVFIVVIIFLVLVILGIGCYILYDRGLIFAKSDETTQIKSESSNEKLDIDDVEDEDFLFEDLESDNVDISDVEDVEDVEDIEDMEDETEYEEDFSLLEFDASKCINDDDDVEYTLRAYGNGFDAELSKNQKTLTLMINWTTIHNRYSIDRVYVATEQFTLNFSQKVEDIFVGEFGQSATGDTILFLMEDGSVEYIPLYKAATTKKFASYGKLEGVSDVVKFYSASAYVGQTGNGVTTLAQKSDGTFYDLSSILRATGNY